MNDRGSKRHAPIDNDGLKPRTRRKDVPEDYDDDDFDEGYDVINKDGRNSRPPANEDMGQE